jgi:hypothetical protein
MNRQAECLRSIQQRDAAPYDMRANGRRWDGTGAIERRAMAFGRVGMKRGRTVRLIPVQYVVRHLRLNARR